MLAKFKSSENNTIQGGVEGEPIPPEVEYETRDPALGAGPNPLGNGGTRRREVDDARWDEPLNLVDIRMRFEARTAARLGPRTQQDYWMDFRRFAEHVDLERYTPRQLQGPKGGELLIAYAARVNAPSRNRQMASIKKVWRKGLGLVWPLDKDDLPRPPLPRIVPGPRRDSVAPWVHAARNEGDLYERSWFLAEPTFGLYGKQQSAIRRADIVFNEATGKPLGILTDRDKTGQHIIAPFPAEIADAVDAWLKAHPDASADAPVWPWRDSKGNIDPKRQHTNTTLAMLRHNFARRWRLPWLTAKAMRKFAKSVLIDSGMPDPYKSFWQGHKPKRNDMDFVYGTRQWDEIFAEQLRYLPDGPIGVFAQVTTTEEVPPELRRLWVEFQAGKIDRLEVADALQALRRMPPIQLKP